MLATIFASACGTPHEGLGLGRPDFVGRTNPPPLGITLSRLVAPSPNASGPAFVELVNNSNTAINTGTTSLWLQTISGSVTLPAATWAPGATLTLQGATLDPLNLHGTAGELIVLGDSLNLEAYACWGADPNTLPGGLNRLARSQGLSASWQPLPYPVSASVAINLDGNTAAAPCVTGDIAATPPFAAADCQGTTPAGSLYLSRVQPSGVDPNGPAIEIYNPGPNALDFTAVQLCTRGLCQPLMPLNQNSNAVGDTWLPPAHSLATEGSVDTARRRIVLAGGIALTPNDVITTIPGVASQDEVALLAPGRALSDSIGLLAYARLSTAPSSQPGPTALAAQMAPSSHAALWQNVTLQAPVLAGESLALKVNDAQAPWHPQAWTLDASPFGTVLADGNAPYNACSAPAISKPRADLVIAQITSLGSEGVVFLLNTSDAPITLADYSLSQGPNVTIALDTAKMSNGADMLQVQPGSLVRVAMSPEQQCPEPYNLCWHDSGVSLATGEVTLMYLGTPTAHVQWGTTSLTSENGAAATLAGVWPLPRCRMGAFTGEEDYQASLVLLPGRAGTAPGDYGLGAQAVGSDIYVANP